MLSGLRKLLSRKPLTPPARPRHARRRVTLERLEDRLAPALASWVCGSGNWNTASCWSTGQLPGPADDVVIDRPGNITVTSTLANTSINSLSNAETLQITGTTGVAAVFSVAGAAQNNAGATLRLRRVTFGGGGTLTNLGVLETQGVTRIDTGFVNQQGATLRAFASNLFGPATANGLTFASGFTNFGLIELTSSGGSFTMSLRITNGTLTNANGGVLTSLVGTGGGRNVVAPVVNQGRINVAQNFTLDNADRSFISTAGTINVSTGRALAIKGGRLPTQGLVRFGSGTVLSGTGSVDLGGEHVVELPTDFTLAAGGPTLTFSGHVTVNGPGLFINQTTFQSTSDRFNAVVVNQGTFVTAGPGNEIFGGFVSGNGTTLRVLALEAYGAAEVTFSQGFTNNGRIELTSFQNLNGAATLRVLAGTLVNPVGSVIEVAGELGARTIAASITNEGQLNLVRSLTVDNAGRTFTCLTGRITFPGSASLNLANGDSVFGDAIVVLIGTSSNLVNLTGVHTMTLGASVFFLRSDGPQLKLIGQVTINGPGLLISQIPLELTGDIINATLENQATVIAWGAGNQINGPYSATAGSGIRIEGRNECAVPYGPGSCRDAELLISQDFMNNGPLTLTSADSGWNASLLMPAGRRLTNAHVITAEAGPGTAGERTIQAEVHNYWEINVNAPNLSLSGQGVAENLNAGNGVINATLGNLVIFGQVSTHNLATFNVGNGKYIVLADGTLANFGGTTLTGGTYRLNNGCLYFPGANIVTNLADIQLTGTGACIQDESFNDALANFTVNGAAGRFALSNRVFDVAGNFTNHGVLVVDGQSAFNVLAPGATLTNFSGGTLTGGTYEITGVFRFNGADIRINSASLTLSTQSSAIRDESNNDGLANYTENSAAGTLILQNGKDITRGTFTNAGLVQIDSGSIFRLSTTFQQFGTGTLRLSSGQFIGNPGASLTNEEAGTRIEGEGAIDLRGTLTNRGTVAPGLPTPTSIATLTLKGNYVQESGGTLEINLRGDNDGDVFVIQEFMTGDGLGQATFAGTLAMQPLTGYTPMAMHAWVVTRFRVRAAMTPFDTITPAGYTATYSDPPPTPGNVRVQRN